MSDPNQNVALIREYMRAIENRASGAAIAKFLTNDVVHQQFPNRLAPEGSRDDLNGRDARGDCNVLRT